MEVLIEGKKYNFFIKSWDEEFFIQAIDKKTGLCSCINNLNTILSELDVDINNPRFFDSSWTVSNKEGQRFFRAAVGLLKDKDFAKYLEEKLDEDRTYGEWENRVGKSPVLVDKKEVRG